MRGNPILAPPHPPPNPFNACPSISKIHVVEGPPHLLALTLGVLEWDAPQQAAIRSVAEEGDAKRKLNPSIDPTLTLLITAHPFWSPSRQALLAGP